MTADPDEKKRIIVLILDQMRIYRPALGNYVESIHNENSDYFVRLSNGRIRLGETLVYDFEASPSAISEIRLQHAAKRFIPDIPVITGFDQSEETDLEAPMPAFTPKRKSATAYQHIVMISIIVWLGHHDYQVWQARELVQAKFEARISISNLITVESSNNSGNHPFGDASGLKVTVANKADYLAEIVKVRINYFNVNGEIAGTDVLSFNNLAPRSTQTMEFPVSKHGVKIDISRESFTCTALGIR